MAGDWRPSPPIAAITSWLTEVIRPPTIMSLQIRCDLVELDLSSVRRIAKYFIVALLATGRIAYAGFSDCLWLFPQEQPPVVHAAPEKLRELCFNSFAVLHSGQSKTPVFVVERLSRALLSDAQRERRTERFYEEARLPVGERAHLDDYRAPLVVGGRAYRFDRGHQAPAADMSTPQSMSQSFSLANMVPQAPANNRQAWAGIEKATRKYVMRASGDVYVMTGPVFTSPVPVLGQGQVWVPKYLYKLVYDPSRNRAWAHWMENRDDARTTPPISYEELVKRTGIAFLPGLHPQD